MMKMEQRESNVLKNCLKKILIKYGKNKSEQGFVSGYLTQT